MRKGWKRLAEGALVAASALLILVTLLPLIPSNEWWIRILDFPRAQIAAALLVLLIGVAMEGMLKARRGLALAAALALCLAYQAVRILPYVPLYPKELAGASSCAAGDRLRIIEANVLQDNRDSGALIALVRRQRPDVLLLTETDRWWAGQVRPLAAELPHLVSAPLGNTYGMMLLSRRPLAEPEIRYLLEPDIPSIRARLTLESGRGIDLYAVHPRPPLPGKDTEDRDAELVVVGREVRTIRRPAIVVGDFNDVAWSDTTMLFREVSGLHDPRVGRGLYATFPADLPLLRWPLDYIFVSPGFTLTGMKRLGDIGSDHLPIQVDLCAGGLDSSDLPPPTLPGDVKAEAKETVREGVTEE